MNKVILTVSLLVILIDRTWSQIQSSKSLKIKANSRPKSNDIEHLKKKLKFDKSNLNFFLNDEKEIPVELLMTGEGLLNIDICLGTPSNQCFDVILDSGSYILWVPNNLCTSSLCPNNKYNPEKSSTNVKTAEIGYIGYATGSVRGFYNKDKFTLNSINKNSNGNGDLRFLSADKADFPSKSSNGILGMGRNYEGMKDEQMEDSVMYALKKSNEINKNIFAHSWSNYYDAELTIGDYPDELQNSKFANYTTCPVRDLAKPSKSEFSNGYWSCELDDVIIGDQVININAGIIWDSGSNSLLTGYQYFDTFVLFMTEKLGISCYPIKQEDKQLGFLACKISSKEDIKNIDVPFGFKVNGINYTIKMSNMFVDFDVLKEYGYNKKLQIVFSGDSKNWLVGTPFLKRFTVVYDKENMLVGFAPNYKDLEHYTNILPWIMIAVGLVSLILISVVLFFVCKRMKKQRSIRERGDSGINQALIN